MDRDNTDPTPPTHRSRRARRIVLVLAVAATLLAACNDEPQPTGALLDTSMLPAGFEADATGAATIFAPGCDDTHEMFDRWSSHLEGIDAWSADDLDAGHYQHLRGYGIPRVDELIDLLPQRMAYSGCAQWEVVDTSDTVGTHARWLEVRDAGDTSPVALLVVTDDHTLHYLMRDNAGGGVEAARRDLEVVLAELLS